MLNYLGYSWIDQGVNLDDGMRMIKRSVEQRADDGYIVDSLGWAYYRLGNMEEAVKQLERAVELKPEPEDLVKIEAKLKSGLPDAPETEHKKPGGG